MHRNFGKCKKFEKYEGNISGGVCTLWMKERESQEVLYVTQPQNAKTDIILPQFPFSEMPTPG